VAASFSTCSDFCERVKTVTAGDLRSRYAHCRHAFEQNFASARLDVNVLSHFAQVLLLMKRRFGSSR
jgi:hypothetical protein